MKIKQIKLFLLFICTLLLAFAFPLQVISLSPLPALIPYIILAIIFSLTKLQKPYSFHLKWNIRKPIIFIVSVYLALVVFNTAWQTILGYITLADAISAVVNFLLPLLFFVYFRNIATSYELRTTLLAISLAGLISGVYFTYDSYSMLVTGELNDYSLQAFNYSELRSPDQVISDSRISVGSRSHGLLESHSVSAALIVIGCFSALTLLHDGQRLKRGAVITLAGMMILSSLNFTSIVGFSLLIFIFEAHGYTLLHGAISKRLIKLIKQILIMAMIIGLAAFIFVDANYTAMVEAVYMSLIGQLNLASGNVEVEGSTYFMRLLYTLISYPTDIFIFPSLLIGDGFSSFGMKKGGDYGIVETLHRFGIPFFVTIIFGLIGLVCRIIKKEKKVVPEQSLEMSYLWFGAAVVTYLLFTEIHYSVWNSKSLLPILFICLAIFDKYIYSLNPPRSESR